MKLKRMMTLILLLSMALNVVGFSKVAYAAEGKQQLKINNTVLEFDKIIYVDATKGDDATADGTAKKPYKTLEGAIEQVTNEEYSYCFKLGNGTYEQGRWIRETKCMNQITVIGNGKSTRLVTVEEFSTQISGPTDICKCSFIYMDFIWDDTGKGSTFNRHGLKTDVKFYNILFDLSVTDYTSSYLYTEALIEMTNCSMTKPVVNFIYKYIGQLKFTNCYGPFKSGDLTSQEDWDYKTNLIVNEAKLDSNYSITEGNWENAGTGKNPNGTQAHIGVYGGEFAWGDTLTENQLKVVLEPTETLQLSVDDNLDLNTTMNWSSSDKSVATVDENGVVTALKKGDTTITVISKDGAYTVEIHILVVDDATDLRLALDMKAGTKRRVTINDLTDTKQVTWASMDTETATIDVKGKITAKKKGLVLITATDENGEIIGTIYVRVRD